MWLVMLSTARILDNDKKVILMSLFVIVKSVDMMI